MHPHDKTRSMCVSQGPQYRSTDENMILSIAEIWQGITGQQLDDPRAAAFGFEDAVVDSRLAKEGTLFIALRGEKDDGHNYVGHAFEHGASAAIIDTVVDGVPLIVDTTQRPLIPPPDLVNPPLTVSPSSTASPLLSWRVTTELPHRVGLPWLRTGLPLYLAQARPSLDVAWPKACPPLAPPRYHIW